MLFTEMLSIRNSNVLKSGKDFFNVYQTYFMWMKWNIQEIVAFDSFFARILNLLYLSVFRNNVIKLKPLME